MVYNKIYNPFMGHSPHNTSFAGVLVKMQISIYGSFIFLINSPPRGSDSEVLKESLKTNVFIKLKINFFCVEDYLLHH